MAILSFAYCDYAFHGGKLGSSWWAGELNGVLWSANLWLWMLTVVAWAQYFFTRSFPWLAYLNRGVFCFYVLHQTLIIVIAYFLVPMHLGPIIEPTLIIISVFVSCLILYELLRRIPFVGILFGARRE